MSDLNNILTGPLLKSMQMYLKVKNYSNGSFQRKVVVRFLKLFFEFFSCFFVHFWLKTSLNNCFISQLTETITEDRDFYCKASKQKHVFYFLELHAKERMKFGIISSEAVSELQLFCFLFCFPSTGTGQLFSREKIYRHKYHRTYRTNLPSPVVLIFKVH